MPHGSLSAYIHHLCRGPAPAQADWELLARFVRARDAAAFAELVRRHGPMVYGVCRRLLRDRHAAEDAWQATFLALALRAGSVRRPQALAGWLYRVAYRVCLSARQESGPREESVDFTLLPGPDNPAAEAARRELSALVAAEVERLPEPFRTTFVLCAGAGHSNAEAARLLGCAVGTVESRLTRARRRLRRALERRGLTPESLACVYGPLAVAPELTQRTARAAVAVVAGQVATAGLVSVPVVQLAERVVRSMATSKLQHGVAALAVLVSAGLGWGLFASAQPPGQIQEVYPPPLVWHTRPIQQSPVEEIFAKGELLSLTAKSVRLRPTDALTGLTNDAEVLQLNQPRVIFTQETTLMQIELPKGVSFALDDKTCQRPELMAGMMVEVWVRKTEKGRTVIRLAARHREPVFAVVKIDGWGSGLTVVVPGSKGPILRLPVSDRVQVVTPERLIPIIQLAPGTRVRLTMDESQRVVQRIEVLKDE